MKAITWMGGSKDDLVAFPPDARREVLHCFHEQTRKTAKRDLNLARQRFQAIPHRSE